MNNRDKGSYIFFVMKRIAVRLAMLLVVTVLFSVVFRTLRESGIFTSIPNYNLYVIVYCTVELLVLLGFWFLIYRFSDIGRSISRDPGEYYLITIIDFVLYAAIMAVTYIINWDVFSWIFRVTLNLTGTRFADTPIEVMPIYFIVYLAITLLIMLLNPVIDRIQYKRWKKWRNEIDG